MKLLTLTPPSLNEKALIHDNPAEDASPCSTIGAALFMIACRSNLLTRESSSLRINLTNNVFLMNPILFVSISPHSMFTLTVSKARIYSHFDETQMRNGMSDLTRVPGTTLAPQHSIIFTSLACTQMFLCICDMVFHHKKPCEVVKSAF